jgi:DNA-binding NarL/FixJ family response regulator
MKVVILEDHDLVAAGLQRVLRNLGHEGLHMRRVLEAQAALQTHQEVDVVIADLGLGFGESGLEFLSWLRQHFPSVRRILTSALGRPDDFPDEPPLQLFLQKPFGRSELAALLNEPAKAQGGGDELSR